MADTGADTQQLNYMTSVFHTVADNNQTDAANSVAYAMNNFIVNTMQSQISVDQSAGGG